MNLNTLTTFAANFAQDPQQTRYAGQYLNVLNEAQTQFAIDARCLWKDSLISLVSGTPNYTLPSDFMFEKSVTIIPSSSVSTGVDGGIKLEPISRERLQFYTTDHDWTQDSGTPQNYIIEPDADQIVVYPNPASGDAGTNNLILTYYLLPTALANGTDVPLNSNANFLPYHIGIAAYAAWLLLAAEVASPEMQAKRGSLYKHYQDKTIECMDRIARMNSEQMRFIGGRTWR